ncbi:hypothetical protein QCA50_006077 [Cerrena zonata]|uniref:Uncharacterized protein n=1 Tax=Cerrena zonata TaxID=2478898 RepID=A0AAW0GGW1_9APHY
MSQLSSTLVMMTLKCNIEERKSLYRYITETLSLYTYLIFGQNFTFGGIQGFTRKPSTPWFDDDGNFAGIVHQERNLTYVLFTGAGHLVPEWKPAAALVFLREFVLGNNETGLLLGNETIGGENSTLANDVLPGGGLIYYGSATTSGTFTVPAATIASWESFIATATAQVLNTNSGMTMTPFLPLTTLAITMCVALLV